MPLNGFRCGGAVRRFTEPRSDQDHHSRGLTAPGGERYAVYVAEGDGDTATVHARTITLGRVTGNLVAINGGVHAGDRVVVMGASLLKDGEDVRVIP